MDFLGKFVEVLGCGKRSASSSHMAIFRKIVGINLFNLVTRDSIT
jgi:hypothetical protein